jgi:hypothetical protein
LKEVLMRTATGFLTLSMAVVLAIGCDSVSSSSPSVSATVDAPQPEAKIGSKSAVRRKKKEPGITTAPTISTERRANL